MEVYESSRKALSTRLEEIDVEIAHLQSRIAALEAERVDLYGRQNALEPVSRLPPELLVKIFSAYVTRFDHSDLMHFGRFKTIDAQEDIQEDSVRADMDRKLRRPDIFTLCHVSRRWRHAALGCQSLWSHIQVQAHTSPDIIWFMWSKSGDLPVRLDFAGTQTYRHSNNTVFRPGPATNMVGVLLRDNVDRFQSIGIYCDADQLLEVMRGRADKLKSLVAADDYRDGRYANASPLGGTPNLRHLSLTSISIPWSSTLLSSPHLTHIELDRTPPPTPESVARLISLLRTLRRILETFKLGMDIPARDADAEYYLTRVKDRTAIDFLVLRELHLRCDRRGPFMATLSLLRIPQDVVSLKLVSESDDEALAEAILDFASCGRSPDNYIFPEDVALVNDTVLCWRERRFIWTENGGELHPTQTFEMVYQPIWIETTLCWSTTFRLPWSLSNLRVLSILRFEVPDGFWTILSASRTLEMIRIGDGESRSFLQALSKDYGHDGGIYVDSMNYTSIERNHTSPARPITFPALKGIHFIFITSTIDIPPGSGDASASGAPAGSKEAHIATLVAALQRRSRTVTGYAVHYDALRGLGGDRRGRFTSLSSWLRWNLIAWVAHLLLMFRNLLLCPTRSLPSEPLPFRSCARLLPNFCRRKGLAKRI